jgi:hypothetical protein
VVNEIIRNGAPALAGVAVIALGIPVYYLFARPKSGIRDQGFGIGESGIGNRESGIGIRDSDK